MKILEQKFPKPPSNSHDQTSEELELNLGYDLPIHLKKLSLITRLQSYESPLKNHSADSTTEPEIRLFSLKKKSQSISKSSDITVKSLAKYLTDNEVEQVYFLHSK